MLAGFAGPLRAAVLCAREDSNLRPRAPEARALSPELRARRLQCSLTPRARRAHASSRSSSRRRSSSRAARATPRTSSRSRSRRSGVRGHGEAAPIDRYDESPESALAYIEEHAGLIGDDPFALEEIMARLPRERVRRARRDRRRAARPAGQARRAARLPAARPAAASARRRRGRSGSAIPTTWRAAPRRCGGRFKRLKLKLGAGDGLDVERVARGARASRTCRCRST